MLLPLLTTRAPMPRQSISSKPSGGPARRLTRLWRI
jgi:hypothetical protein